MNLINEVGDSRTGSASIIADMPDRAPVTLGAGVVEHCDPVADEGLGGGSAGAAGFVR
jgi:hypothetical protein